MMKKMTSKLGIVLFVTLALMGFGSHAGDMVMDGNFTINSNLTVNGAIQGGAAVVSDLTVQGNLVLSNGTVNLAGATVTGLTALAVSGLGTAATNNVGAFATAAQGVKADRAQPTNGLTSIIYSNASMFATAAQGAKANAAITNNHAAAVILANKLGIGTTTPAARLSIGNVGAGALLLFNDMQIGSYYYRSGFFRDMPYPNDMTFGVSKWQNMVFGKTADSVTPSIETEWMRINNNGNVGVGTTSPQAKLHVAGNTIIASNLTVNGAIFGNGSSLTNIAASNIVGLASAAYSSSNAFATAAQGAKADTALQAGDMAASTVHYSVGNNVKENFDVGWVGLPWGGYANNVTNETGWIVNYAQITNTVNTNTFPYACRLQSASLNNSDAWIQTPLLTNGVGTLIFYTRMGTTPVPIAIEQSYNGGITWSTNNVLSIDSTIVSPYTNIFALSAASCSNQYLRIRPISNYTANIYIDSITIIPPVLTNSLSGIASSAMSALQPTGSGAQLTGITAAQVGAVSNNDPRIVNALTSAVNTDDPAGVVNLLNGVLSIGTNGVSGQDSVAVNDGTATNLTINGGIVTNLTLSGQVTVDTNSVFYIPPQGDLSMGSFTNRPVQ